MEPARSLRTEYANAVLTGEVPLKLVYCGPLAQFYLDLRRPERQKNVTSNVDLELELICKLPTARPTVFVDIGVGDGTHAAQLLKRASSAGIEFSAYMGLDLSSPLLHAARHKVSRLHLPIDITTEVWDFEVAPTKVIAAHKREHVVGSSYLLALLGLTLGNVADPSRTLSNIRRSVSKGDWLLVGLAAPVNDRSQMLAPYDSDEFRRASLAPLTWLGIDTRQIEVRFSYENGSVVGRFYTLGPIEFRESKVVVESGSRITFLRSKRFTMDDVISLCADTGWLVQANKLDNAGDLSVLLRAD